MTVEFYTGQTQEKIAQLAATTEDTVRQWLCHDERFFTVLSEMQFDRILCFKYRLLKLISVPSRLCGMRFKPATDVWPSPCCAAWGCWAELEFKL